MLASYEWNAVQGFLAAHLVPGVSAVSRETYRRTITMAGAPGLIEVSPSDGSLLLRVHLPYWEGLIHLVDRVGQLLGVFTGDGVPGTWNLFEAGVWAILSGRPDLLKAFVTRLGTPVPGLPDGLTHTFPDPAAVTSTSLAESGLPTAERAAIMALA